MCLPEEVDPVAIFTLRDLENNPVRWNSGPLDALVCGPQKEYSESILDLSARPRIWLPPLCGETTGYPFQGSGRLHTYKPVDRGNKRREVLILLEAILQVHLLIFPLRLL